LKIESAQNFVAACRIYHNFVSYEGLDGKTPAVAYYDTRGSGNGVEE
jgi:hypothetical protein